MNIGKKISTIVLFCSTIIAWTQKIETIPFGDFENWLARDIQESYILGGHTKRIYAIAPKGQVKGALPYKPKESPWTTSNALAVVSGVTKTSNSVFPEIRTNGNLCASLKSDFVVASVLGLIDIKVMAQGTIFLGETIEPITSADEPYAKLSVGIPFIQKPKALIYDYKSIIHTDSTIVTAKGWSVDKTKGVDYPQVFILLQNRQELPDGSIVATRVGTAKEYIKETTPDWVNNHRLPVWYGDIRKHKEYKPYMNLTNIYYAKNSKGQVVPIKETAWGNENTPVTHLIVFFSSGMYGAYIGALGNVLKVDNIKLEY